RGSWPPHVAPGIAGWLRSMAGGGGGLALCVRRLYAGGTRRAAACRAVVLPRTTGHGSRHDRAPGAVQTSRESAPIAAGQRIEILLSRLFLFDKYSEFAIVSHTIHPLQGSHNAGVAQLVEHNLAKVGVAGSSQVTSSAAPAA